MRIGRSRGKAGRRRLVLLRGIGAGLAGLLPAFLEDAPVRMVRRGRVGDTGGAAVPATTVSLADFGGTPGAHRALLIGAFSRAFAALADAGGGTLLVPAGVYDFGPYAYSATIILCRDLRDIAISAYGATFTATTTAKAMPSIFYFFNFHNITIAGASFTDHGFNPRVDWKGLYCVSVQADRASSGFRLVDCFAERVTGLFATHNDAAGRMFLSDVSVQGEVRYAYYGAGVNFIREKVRVELVCHNVRRACIAFSLRHGDIRVKNSSTSNWPGSNGLVALVSGGAGMGDVEHVRVEVEVAGECIHSSYVHFYHQGPEREGRIGDIDATVHVVNVRSTRSLFAFDHEHGGVQARTKRTWDRIWLHGSVIGQFRGRVIANPSVTSSPGTVYLDAGLAAMENMKLLARLFRIRAA